LCADEISNNAAVGSQVLALVTSAPFEKLSLSFKSLKQCTWCPNDPHPLHTTLAPLTLAVSSTNNTPGEGKKKNLGEGGCKNELLSDHDKFPTP